MDHQALDTLHVNIDLCQMYIIQRIAEGITENLRRNELWPVSDYIEICRTVMKIKHIPLEVERSIITQAVTDGYENYFQYKATGFYTYHNGCEQHPELLLGDQLDRLGDLLQN